MRTKLFASLSGALLALAGCTTENAQVSAPVSTSYGPPPSSNPPRYVQEETRSYASSQPQAPQQQQPATAPGPDYREQAPAYDPSLQDAPPTSIQRVEDFQEPLREYGRWLETPEYGRVWQPYDQPNDWRPYSSDGQWVYTSWGWTWQSYQPWGWAAYHYGNWVFMPRCGWVWTPGVVWSPAWVVWRECDDYVAWAPAPPAQFHFFYSSSSYCDWGVRYSDYVVVPRGRFCEPVHRGVIVAPEHSVKIVNKTKNVTKTKFVNKGVINYGPGVAGVEAATGQKVRTQKVADVVKPPERLSKQASRPIAREENEKPARDIRQDSDQPSKRKTVKPQTLANTAPASPRSDLVEPKKALSENRPDGHVAARAEQKAEKQKEKAVVLPAALPTRSGPGSVKNPPPTYYPPTEPKRMDFPGREEPKPKPVARPKQNISREDERKVTQISRRELPTQSNRVSDSSGRKGYERALQPPRAEPQREERVRDHEAKVEKSNREPKPAPVELAGRESKERSSREWKTDSIGTEPAVGYRR
jgi:hypothetical protein